MFYFTLDLKNIPLSNYSVIGGSLSIFLMKETQIDVIFELVN